VPAHPIVPNNAGSGLRVGEIIASTGAFKLRQGVLVNASPSATATTLPSDQDQAGEG
jgi:hypothetical protein